MGDLQIKKSAKNMISLLSAQAPAVGWRLMHWQKQD